jgi:hypothetical protein
MAEDTEVLEIKIPKKVAAKRPKRTEPVPEVITFEKRILNFVTLEKNVAIHSRLNDFVRRKSK